MVLKSQCSRRQIYLNGFCFILGKGNEEELKTSSLSFRRFQGLLLIQYFLVIILSVAHLTNIIVGDWNLSVREIDRTLLS
jgi:hypothetical protein